MPASNKYIRDILKTMEDAIESFQTAIPDVQQGLLESLMNALKDLETDNGRLLNRVANLKLINQLKNRIERLIISEGYKDSIREFVKAFDVLGALHIEYFSQFNQKYTPSKTLPIIRQTAIDKTLNDLLGQGLQSNVVDALHGVLTDNVTTGGSYASLAEQLRTSITGTEQTEGLLERYSRTITTDAINQYSAQYHETIAADLSMNWGRYVGSNLTTTREFCELLTKKEWVHKSELPEIVKGHIDGNSCRLSKSTGLPLGMIPGTDASNFKVRRGGYNCGHQFFWVPDSAVPENIKQRL